MNESREVLESTGELTAPIFVDSTGRRRRRLHWLGYGVGAACVGYAIVVVVSLLGGPISPGKVMPGYPERPPNQTAERLRPQPLIPENSAMDGAPSAVPTAPPTPSPTRTRASRPPAPSGQPRPSASRTPAPSPSSVPSPSATPRDDAAPLAPVRAVGRAVARAVGEASRSLQ